MSGKQFERFLRHLVHREFNKFQRRELACDYVFEVTSLHFSSLFDNFRYNENLSIYNFQSYAFVFNSPFISQEYKNTVPRKINIYVKYFDKNKNRL